MAIMAALIGSGRFSQFASKFCKRLSSCNRRAQQRAKCLFSELESPLKSSGSYFWTTDCKSVGLCLRWFESSRAQLPWLLQLSRMDGGFSSPRPFSGNTPPDSVQLYG